MLLKNLIQDLTDIYNKEVQGDYLKVMGEPEIMIDTFEEVEGTHTFVYKGFDHKIKIDRSSDGVYLILNRFSE